MGYLHQLDPMYICTLGNKKKVAFYADLPLLWATPPPALEVAALAADVCTANAAEDAKRLPRNCHLLTLPPRDVPELPSPLLLSTHDRLVRAAAGGRVFRRVKPRFSSVSPRLGWDATPVFKPRGAYACAAGHTKKTVTSAAHGRKAIVEIRF